MVCSGVISAYRKSILLKVIPKWLSQKFLGVKCTYGDDRSLTNLTIKNGYDTVYNRNAIAYTLIPENLKKLIKMFIRWNKSYIRESLIFASFIFSKKIKKRFKSIAILDFVLTNLGIILYYIALVVGFIYFFFYPLYVIKFLTMIALISGIYMLFYLRIEKTTDFIYGILYAYISIFALSWIPIYAGLTLKDNSWLTR
jgi:hyaluronan synthase